MCHPGRVRPRSMPLLCPSIRMQLQRMTTAEPDDGMVEVAIAALARTLRDDGVQVDAIQIPVAGKAPVME